MNTRLLRFPGRVLLPLLSVASLSAAERPWQKLTNPTVAEVAANFSTPPTENSSQVTWGWNGIVSRESIARDLDRIRSMNLYSAWVEPGRNPEAHYLSAAYFENVKIAVEEAKKRGMHLWFDDDGGYPSGFAGGKFSLERPDLDMKALAPTEQVPLANGETFSRALDEKTICALALNLDTGTAEVIEAKSGQVTWTAPASGKWAVALPHWVFRSGVTKSANNKSGAKDSEHSLMDYLDPAAGKQFNEWTFAAYKKVVGDEFGKTVLGFRGDEAAFGFNPWTPKFLEEFKDRKGYDLRPYLPAISAIQIGRGGRRSAPPAPVVLDAAHRAFADYCDVWSDLFAKNFFSAGAKWCADNDVEMQTHIEHEEILPQLASANGDFFKCMRDIAVPGIDVIWHQVWHDVVADFPKLASSATHLNGRPQAMSESFAAMTGAYATPNFEEAGWIVNHQIALGINHFEFMSLRSSAPMPAGAMPPPGPPRNAAAMPRDPNAPLIKGAAPTGYRYMNDPKFPGLAAYTNRATYVLQQGKPGAQIGVYLPSSSFWFGDGGINKTFLAAVHTLLEHQRDLDFVDDYSIATSFKLRGGEFVNLSGQGYHAIVIPPAVAVSEAALKRLRAFAKAGGKVVFLGGAPKLIMGKNFLSAGSATDLDWATVEAADHVTDNVLAVLPDSEVSLDQAAPGLKYIHRHLKDGEAYFFFNEGDSAVTLNANVWTHATAVQAQNWDAMTGQISPLNGVSFAKNKATLPLHLESWATQLVILSTTAGGVASNP